MHQTNQASISKRAFFITEFCRRYGVGRTRAFDELKAGRLRGRKIGRRTIITEDDAETWLRNLPDARGRPKGT